ncbi:MAG: glycerophosphodiester phosphodiesterase [Pseudomonadota bacterium]|nr:glycerophosphodiester phosphodiesterase [Pseudomonadota bacterium]
MLLVGHRGARGEAPENTLGGFAHLRQLGIHHVELDVRLSADDALVVLHDTSVNRTTAHNGPVSGYTAAQLAQMNAALVFPPWPRVEPIPRLETVVAEWPQLKSIQFEVKSASQQTLRRIAQLLTDLIQRYALGPRAIITSSDQAMLAIMQRRAPQVQRGFVAERFTRGPLEVCLSHHCRFLVVNYHRCNPTLVARAQALGLKVSAWTVNDINAARRLQQWGVDSLITDAPSLLLKHLHVAPE